MNNLFKSAFVKIIFLKLVLMFSFSMFVANSVRAESLETLTQVEAKFVCMVNNTVFPKEQIAIPYEGKTYYGCCSMCASKLSTDLSLREAVDPISGKIVDKAKAIIGVSPKGDVYYFESKANLLKYEKEKTML